MVLPETVASLIRELSDAGYPAYAVGGCVRDALLGIRPHDWDLCTSALPEEMLRVFAGDRVIETGLKHGTVTVLRDHVPYEITTFRTDGVYSDHRHPDSVSFVPELSGDLSRRDFTVNAMAYSPASGLVDLFGGREDLRRGVIRCVGDPARRFEEDALRVLRALRFASVCDFTIDGETARAVHRHAADLTRVAGERIREELLKLLCGPGAGRILREYPDVLAVIVPEIAPMVGYDQANHHHVYDLWEHTVLGVENIPPDPLMRLVMLLHDTGKPACRTTDENGEGHYRGHPKRSAEIAFRTAEALRMDHESRDRLCLLVLNHDTPLRTQTGEVDTSRSFLLRRLNRYGAENLRALFLIHRADRIATGYSSPEREDARLRLRMDALDALLREQACFSLKDLAVNGRDLTALGLRGPEVGAALQSLLEAVMDGQVPNEKEALLSRIRSAL